MSAKEKAQVLEKVEATAGSKRNVWQSWASLRAHTTAGEPERGRRALRTEGPRPHPGTA